MQPEQSNYLLYKYLYLASMPSAADNTNWCVAWNLVRCQIELTARLID
ncbi:MULTISPECIES: hypothetical protein [unclassified Microcoleus]